MSILGCWTNCSIKMTKKGNCLHCSRAGEGDNQVTMDRGPQRTTACTRSERAAELAQTGGPPAIQPLPHQDLICLICAVRWKPVHEQGAAALKAKERAMTHSCPS